MASKYASNKNVLVIDDAGVCREFLTSPLDKVGFARVDFAHNPKTADKAIDESPYDLVLCAYSLDTEQDGFCYFQQLKNDSRLKSNCAFVILSSDTNPDTIQSIIDCPPDDFIVRPFNPLRFEARISSLLLRKQRHAKLDTLRAQNRTRDAIQEVDKLISNAKQSQKRLGLQKIKGGLLEELGLFKASKTLYEEVLKHKQYAWAQIGAAKALLNGEDTRQAEAERLIIGLAAKPETKASALEMLSQIHLTQDNYEDALQSAALSADFSPKSIERQQTARMVSKLAHDFESEYKYAQRALKLVRGSALERPSHYLDTIRACIDYATICDEDTADDLLAMIKSYISELSKRFASYSFVDDITIIQARLHYFKNNSKRGLQLILDDSLHTNALSYSSKIEKARALFELGRPNESLAILSDLESEFSHRSVKPYEILKPVNLYKVFVQNLKRSIESVKLAPKTLDAKGQLAYKQGNFDKAYEHFTQALHAMPKNANIALSLMQVLVKLNMSKFMDDVHSILHRCIDTIEQQSITHEQSLRYSKLKQALNV